MTLYCRPLLDGEDNDLKVFSIDRKPSAARVGQIELIWPSSAAAAHPRQMISFFLNSSSAARLIASIASVPKLETSFSPGGTTLVTSRLLACRGFVRLAW